MEDKVAEAIAMGLQRCFDGLHRQMARRCQGGFRGRGRVLAFLRAHDGIAQGELAQALGIRAASVSELVERLVQAELVVRRADAADGRVVRVFLTDAGARLADGVGRRRRQEAQAMLGGLSQAEGVQLAGLLEKLAQGLDAAMPQRAAAGCGAHAHGSAGCCGHHHGQGAGCGHHGAGCHGHAGHAPGGCCGGRHTR